MAAVVPSRARAGRATLARASARRAVGRAATYLIVVLVGLLFLFPFAWLVATSLKTDREIFAYPPTLYPHTIRWANYADAVSYIPFLRYLVNTIIICAGNAIGILVSCSLTAYAFARLCWPGRDAVFVLILATMMLPFQVTMIPLYIVFRSLGWINTFAPLIVPAFFGDAFSIFLFRQFFLTIPFELTDAGRMDGCNEFRLYWNIVLPLSKSALATVALLTILGNWTDFLRPLIYLNNQSQWTLSLGLMGFLGEHSAAWGPLMAASVIFTLPLIVLFFFAQKTFVQGIVTSGLR
jgi:multiple sugar transport system permease protein